MITGELKSRVDRVWDAFWSGGISNPLEVMEQITYLLFIRRLDELETVRDETVRRGVEPGGEPFFGPDQQDLRWKKFKDRDPKVMYELVADGVFPFLRRLGGENSTYSHHLKDARFTIPTPNLLAEVVLLLEGIPTRDKDADGDLYECMLGKIATAGQNGQFRTPRHIIQLMVEMMQPGPRDEICDPACGTAGFLVASAEYVEREHRDALLDEGRRRHYNHSMFHGYDFDSTMLRIGSMNMLLHGVEAPDIRYRDSLSERASEGADNYSLILTNPPFAGSLDYEVTSQDLLKVVKTKKTELLFLGLVKKLLKPGGRAAVIVPDGILFGTTKAHRELRRQLVEEQKLDAVVKLPSGVFKPYAGISTSILIFTRTDSGGTDSVWFYDVQADGFSLDDKRAPLLAADRLGVCPAVGSLPEEEKDKNNLPDVLDRWFKRHSAERTRARTHQSFCVPRSEIADRGYDLSLNRYAERPRYISLGQRVAVTALFQAGLLPEGTQLHLKCAGKTHSAKVTAAGRLLLAGGQQFPSPSSAAAAVVGEGAVDGWKAWAMEDGTTLDQLRQEFLSTPAVESPYMDVESAAPPSSAEARPIPPGESHLRGDGGGSVAGLTVGDLPSALGGIVCVPPSANLDEAITRMVINDFSQLPVLSGRTLRGAVTWKSIAQARHASHNPPLARAVTRAQEVDHGRDLIDILPMLEESEFVLVRNQKNEVAGIVTASDMASAYGAMATPFFLIGELDRRLRSSIASSVRLRQVQNLCDPGGDRSIAGFDDLSIGDYQRVLENVKAWEMVGWPLDRKVFIERLAEVREIRNSLMHFNPEPLPKNATQKIRHMINVLRQYGS